jgi:hypothetical protein
MNDRNEELVEIGSVSEETKGGPDGFDDLIGGLEE